MYEDDWLESDYEDRNGSDVDVFDDWDLLDYTPDWALDDQNVIGTATLGETDNFDNKDDSFEIVAIVFYDPETDSLTES